MLTERQDLSHQKEQGFLCGPLRISAVSCANRALQRRDRRDTQRTAEELFAGEEAFDVFADDVHFEIDLVAGF
jgi:hypothetical protein